MRYSILPALAGAAIFGALSIAPAQAQATRTWVSGVGDDVNPCSRTAPCKTFAGAISKTFINGEINCLDPGGFGTITITKSMTIDCHDVYASILASGSPSGILINIAPGNANDPLQQVRIRNLDINGAGASGTVGTRTGTNGVRIIAADSVLLEDLVVASFASNGITDERLAGRLAVNNSTVFSSGSVGVRAQPGSGVSALKVSIDNVRSVQNSIGMAFFNGAKAMIKRSTVSNNNNSGVESDNVTGAALEVNVDDSAIANNGTGIFTSGGTMRLSNTDLAFNGLAASGNWVTFGNNRVSGSAGTAPTGAGAASTDLGQK